MTQWIDIIVSILSGLAVCIPLVWKLVQFVEDNVKEKKWDTIVEFVLELMETAETTYETGAERKEYVMNEVEVIQKRLGTSFDAEKISELVDAICDTSKVLNK